LTTSEVSVPTYSYACTECGNRFDAVQSFTDAALTTCSECNGRLRKLFGNVGVVFKGSGFYRTDSREAAKSSATSSANGSDSTSESTGSSSSSSDKSSSDKSSSDKSSSDKSSATSSNGSSSGSTSSAPAAAASS
jgi:putative FmdB family regulatory protein